jgi:hypothetical protein
MPAATTAGRSATAAAAPAGGSGNEDKYVVWSSVPSDVPRSGPDDR